MMMTAVEGDVIWCAEVAKMNVDEAGLRNTHLRPTKSYLKWATWI